VLDAEFVNAVRDLAVTAAGQVVFPAAAEPSHVYLVKLPDGTLVLADLADVVRFARPATGDVHERAEVDTGQGATGRGFRLGRGTWLKSFCWRPRRRFGFLV
jgi:hypothetical protein